MLRRKHQKSRQGCLECKRRHIKCDENKPACSNCNITERQCSYCGPSPRLSSHTARSSPDTTQSQQPNRLNSSPWPMDGPVDSNAIFGSNINIQHMELLVHFSISLPIPEFDESLRISTTTLVLDAELIAPYLLYESLAISARHLATVRPEVFHTEDRQIPVTKPQGFITVRIYTPQGSGPFLVHLNFHGGGWVLGGLQSEAAWCRHMCNKASIKVIDVDYRMGPEYKYPTAIYDCWDAVKWAINNATELNMDPKSVSFGGLSAGGHMTAVLGHFARDEGIDIKLQLMIVPTTDMRYCSSKLKQLTAENCSYESVFQLNDVPWGPLGREQWFLKYFVGEDADELEEKLNNEWILTPVIVSNFKHLPRAHIVTAEFDLERDGGEYYGQLLKDGGNEVTVKCYIGCPHAFAHYNHPERGLSKAFEFIEDTAELLRDVHEIII